MKNLLRIIIMIIFIIIIISCQSKEDASKFKELKVKEATENANVELIKKTWDAWNNRDRSFVNSVLDSNYKFYPTTGDPMSQKQAWDMVGMFWKAFPDIKLNIVAIYASGDFVITKLNSTGTQKEDFMGIPATGNKINVIGINICHIKNGKIVEEWELFDNLTMMTQLGLELKPKTHK